MTKSIAARVVSVCNHTCASAKFRPIVRPTQARIRANQRTLEDCLGRMITLCLEEHVVSQAVRQRDALVLDILPYSLSDLRTSTWIPSSTSVSICLSEPQTQCSAFIDILLDIQRISSPWMHTSHIQESRPSPVKNNEISATTGDSPEDEIEDSDG